MRPLRMIIILSFSLFPFFAHDSSGAETSDRTDPTPVFEAVAEAGAAYLNNPSSCPGIISAQALWDNLENYTVVDLRTLSSYESGHIPGSYHSSLSTLVDDLGQGIPDNGSIVLVGYTGQVSSQAKFALEMLGYSNVRLLAFGMSSWNTDLDSWSNNCADALANPETANQNENLEPQEFPILEGLPEDAVRQRVAAMLEMGFRGVSYEDILPDLEEFFIINYFGEADYLGWGSSGVPGHIPGAFQFTPYTSLGLEQMLGFIPPDQPVVVYDWIGLHSSQVVAYLNMLGYEAYSLKFGANALFHSSLTAHVWTPASMNNFPLEFGPQVAPVVLPEPTLNSGLSNHPNPFNPHTTVSFALDHSQAVEVSIFDLTGRRIAVLADRVFAEGSHSLAWEGKDVQGNAVASGTYLVRMVSDEGLMTEKMMLVR